MAPPTLSWAEVYRKAGWISPVLLVDDELAGVLEHTTAGDRLPVDIGPFEPLEPRMPTW